MDERASVGLDKEHVITNGARNHNYSHIPDIPLADGAVGDRTEPQGRDFSLEFRQSFKCLERGSRRHAGRLTWFMAF